MIRCFLAVFVLQKMVVEPAAADASTSSPVPDVILLSDQHFRILKVAPTARYTSLPWRLPYWQSSFKIQCLVPQPAAALMEVECVSLSIKSI